MNLQIHASQQSVHLTLGILRKSQAFFYAFAFFWLDGFAVPAPAQVTQTVSPPLARMGFKSNLSYDGYKGGSRETGQ
ncbi:MAG: hypothetical protein HND47_17815 [Chloroflexi bacterium]|nr:hypothetical protein [Chloroflexota bacterium]